MNERKLVKIKLKRVELEKEINRLNKLIINYRHTIDELRDFSDKGFPYIFEYTNPEYCHGCNESLFIYLNTKMVTFDTKVNGVSNYAKQYIHVYLSDLDYILSFKTYSTFGKLSEEVNEVSPTKALFIRKDSDGELYSSFINTLIDGYQNRIDHINQKITSIDAKLKKLKSKEI